MILWYHSISCVCWSCVDKDHCFDLSFGDLQPEIRFTNIPELKR
jgi:hypothetical protein